MHETILNALRFITANLAALTALGAIATFIWPIYQFIIVRRRDAANRDFEIYHRLIREIVQGDANGDTFQHRQAAAIFELRHFPKYRAATNRMLIDLRSSWAANPVTKPFLLTEIDLTIKATKKKIWQRQ